MTITQGFDSRTWGSLSFYYPSQPSASQLPTDYDHYGDCGGRYIPETNQWLIVIAVEGEGVDNCICFHTFDDPGISQPNQASASFLGYWVINDGPQVSQDSNAPWAAFDRTQKQFYSSRFNETSFYQVYSYDNELSGNQIVMPTIVYEGQVELKTHAGTTIQLNRVQGGSVSQNNRLYLSVDRHEDEGGGVYGFDLVTGKQMLYLPSDGDRFNREIEGLTIWNVDTFNPPNVSGQVHLTVLDNFNLTPNEQIFIRHWSANANVVDHL